MAVDATAARAAPQKCRRTLGDVRLRNNETGELVLIPTPSDDPNDPVNWPQWYKRWVAALICTAMMMCNFLAVGPSIAITKTAGDFFPDSPLERTTFVDAVAAVSFFFTSTALVQGAGNFFWVPLASKYGRRPVYLASYALYLATAIWLIYETSYARFLFGRILMGFGAGAAETIAPISIADVFFLHERGTIMALYTSFLSVGVAFGMIFSGLITIHNDWRVIYMVSAPLIGLILLASIFGFPETSRTQFVVKAAGGGDSTASWSRPTSSTHSRPASEDEKLKQHADGPNAEALAGGGAVPRKQSYWQSLRVFTGKRTDESLLRILVRPLGLIFLPPVLWAALVQSVTIGSLVAMTSNVAVAFEQAYEFEPYQVGLCFIAAVVGSLVGVVAGGHFSDWTADVLTRRNGGVREPEMRLPAIIPCVITAPLALLLYGIGIQYTLHWVCPAVALGLLNLSITHGTNVCLVYAIDCYRPVAGEITLAVLAFKSIFGFLLSFYINPWVDEVGFFYAYGVMAAIAAFVLLLSVPLYFWGKKLRHATWNWKITSCIDWDEDRDAGE